MPSPHRERHEAVDRFLALATGWAIGRDDLQAVGLVGSWARADARASSDVDLVLLTADVAAYVEREEWMRELGAEQLLRTQVWGALTERRFVIPGGIEVDAGIAQPGWAATRPLDPGTVAVCSAGLVPLHDPRNLLAEVLELVRPAPRR